MLYKRWRLRDGVTVDQVAALVRDRIVPHYRELSEDVRLGLEVLDATHVLAIQRWPDRATLDNAMHGERFDEWWRDYAPILAAHTLKPPQAVRIEGPSGLIEAVPVPQEHGDIGSLGFRFGGLAYSPDISGIPDASLPLLQGLEVWIVDALRFTAHPSHFSVKQALAAIERLKPKRAILTHMTTDLDYEALRRELPEGVEPAYDGMVIELS